MNEYFTKENNIDEWFWDNGPNRHDQDIMIVCEYNGDRYCLEKLETNKYGSFSFSAKQLNELLTKVNEWTKKLGQECFLVGRCGGDY